MVLISFFNNEAPFCKVRCFTIQIIHLSKLAAAVAFCLCWKKSETRPDSTRLDPTRPYSSRLDLTQPDSRINNSVGSCLKQFLNRPIPLASIFFLYQTLSFFVSSKQELLFLLSHPHKSLFRLAQCFYTRVIVTFRDEMSWISSNRLVHIEVIMKKRGRHSRWSYMTHSIQYLQNKFIIHS